MHAEHQRQHLLLKQVIKKGHRHLGLKQKKQPQQIGIKLAGRFGTAKLNMHRSNKETQEAHLKLVQAPLCNSSCHLIAMTVAARFQVVAERLVHREAQPLKAV
jgi:hypothetical protein